MVIAVVQERHAMKVLVVPHSVKNAVVQMIVAENWNAYLGIAATKAMNGAEKIVVDLYAVEAFAVMKEKSV